jgi:hypothetical protein
VVPESGLYEYLVCPEFPVYVLRWHAWEKYKEKYFEVAATQNSVMASTAINVEPFQP